MSRRQKDLFPELPDGKKYVSDIPELVAEWHPTKNEEKQPEDFSFGSNIKVWWKCSKGHEWSTQVYHRTHGTGCPICYNERRPEAVRPKTSPDFNLLTENPSLCVEWDYKQNKFPPTHYLPKSGARVHWKCPMGVDHRWAARIDSRAAPQDGVLNGCPFCAGRKPSLNYNLEVIYPKIAADWDNERNTKQPSEYTPSSNHQAWWKCEKGHTWKAAINNRTSGRNCPKCSNKSSRNEIRILAELRALFPNVVSRHKVGQHEVDIYLKDQNIAIEYDGAWWHRSRLDKDQYKQDILTQNGLRLLRVREHPLPYITDEDVFVDGAKAISKEEVGQIVNLISAEAFERYSESADFLNDAAYRTYLDYFPNPFPENSLAEQNPDLAREWHPTRNEPLTPANFTKSASFRAWWLCQEGHEWQATINNRGQRGCPICSGRYATSKTAMAATHPTLATFFHPTKNAKWTTENLKAGTGKMLWWRCEHGHEWQQRGYAVVKMQDNPCPECRKPMSMAESRPDMALAFHPTLNGELTPSDLTAGTGKMLWWQCSNDSSHTWQSTGDNLKKSPRPDLCPKCTKSR